MRQLRLITARVMLAICLYLAINQSFAQVSQTFSTVGTTSFTVPAGISSLRVECWGGGGAGGGCTATPYATGGGGAGGAYSSNNSLSVTACSTYTVIVGTGGVGASARVGGAGGSSSFGNLVTANGGSGGGVNGTGASINGIGADITIGNTYDGGSGGTGTATSSSSGVSGAGGGGAGASGDGGNASSGSAGAAGSGGGGAGAAGKNTTGGGTAGSAPGGGGSGGRNAGTGSVQTGGNGGKGQVKVTYTCPTYSITSVAASAICTGNTNTITLTGTSATLPSGTYTVTYNLSSPNTTSGATATMTVNENGIGTFATAAAITNPGTNTITITNIKSGSGTGCSSAITGRTATFTSSTQPTPIAEFTQGALDTVSNIAVCGTIGGGGQNDMDIESGSPSGSLIQWQISTDGGITWSNAPGPTATATQYVLNPIYCTFESVAGTYYFRVIVTNGSCVGISNRIRLTVTGTSNLTGGVVGANQNFCNSGDPATLTQTTAPTGGSGSYTYQWQSSTDSINFSVISGATSSSYNPPVVNQTTYYRRITVSGGCRAYSNTVSVLITTSVPLSPSDISGYATVCAESSGFNYSISEISGVSSYTWSVPTGWSISSGAGTTGITVTSGVVGQSGNISVYASNVCGAGLSSVLAVSTTAGSANSVISGDTTICGGASASIQVQITGGASPYELVYTNGVTNSSISNYQSGDAISVTPDSTTTFTIVSVASVGGCTGSSNQGSALVTIATPGTWLGLVDNDWSNPSNWCGGVPDQSTNVVVPSDRPNTPIVINEDATVNDILISNGTQVIVTNHTLVVKGQIVATGKLDITNGTIELAGSSAQSISGSMFIDHKIKNLRISNPSGVQFSGTGDTVILTGILDYGSSNCTLYTNGNLTLNSSITGTASVADMTSRGLFSGNRIVGNVNYEKYIPLQSKAWRMLAAPAIGQTIKAAWQGGNNALSNALNPGYGTIITSNLAGATGALGFDIYTPAGATLKVYNSATDGWDGVSSTHNLMNNPKGYMIFIRGDRSVTAYNQNPTPTIMRMTGTLYTPIDNPPPIITVNADKYESIGNPYACAIDFASIGKSGGVQDVFYLWDPGLTLGQYSAYGLGGYQTIVGNGFGYDVIPGGGSYGNEYKGIPSGQAFFVHTSGTTGQVQFNEICKTTDTAQVMRQNNENNVVSNKSLKMRLAVMSNGSPILLDGTVANFNNNYSNLVDFNDILKIGSNASENMGLLRNNKRLVAERRSDIINNDTLFLNILALKRVTYQLELMPYGFGENEVNAWLVDKYLNTSVPISMDSAQKIFFTVDNNALSAATDRFYIKFQPVVTGVMVVAPAPKVKNNAVQGKKTVGLTSIAQIEKGQITFGPNPLKGNNLNIIFNGVKPGKYQLMIYNGQGQLVVKKEMMLLEGTSRNALNLPEGLAAGQYQLAIEQAGNCLWSESLQVN